MDKALMLLAKRPRPQLARGNLDAAPGGSSSGMGVGGDATSRPVQILEINEGTSLERSESVELVPRERKRSRVDAGSDGSERVAARKGLESSKHGGAKSLVITGLQGGDRPSVLQPEAAVEPARFEIQSFERWTAGPHAPLRVFEAFDLPQDFSAYVDRARADVADRCLTRAGRFLADMKHIVREYRADVDGQWRSESIREMANMKEQRAAAEKRADDAELRVQGLSSELEKLKVEGGISTQTINKLSEDLEGRKRLCEEAQKEIDELKSELERCRDEKKILAGEVDSLKSEVEKGVEEIANGLEAGYGRCYARAVVAGLDMAEHSFDDFCAELAQQSQDAEPEKVPA